MFENCLNQHFSKTARQRRLHITFLSFLYNYIFSNNISSKYVKTLIEQNFERDVHCENLIVQNYKRFLVFYMIYIQYQCCR